MVEINFSAIRRTKPHEYLLRFVFGGAATVLAGVIAKYYGPAIGGLFLALPAIFPASSTLMESHEKKRMAKIGHDGTNRGRMVASIDAAGAALGCVGLAGFAVVLWLFLPMHSAWLIIPAALVAWTILSVGLWKLQKSRIFGLRMRFLR